MNCLAALPEFCLFSGGGDALDVLVTLVVVGHLGVKEGLKKGLEALGVGRRDLNLSRVVHLDLGSRGLLDPAWGLGRREAEGAGIWRQNGVRGCAVGTGTGGSGEAAHLSLETALLQATI